MATQKEMNSLLIEKHNGIISRIVGRFRKNSRLRRKSMFHENFKLTYETKILDLGGFNGAHIARLLSETPVKPGNIYVADINADAVNEASLNYGFVPVVLNENEPLPYPDNYFDIVFCSSVIEHVTIPKSMIWDITSGSQFQNLARTSQKKFAHELRRIGKNYFVQAPYRWFFFETHTWLPFFSYIPRSLGVSLIKITNRFWIKKTQPDFFLPEKSDIALYFPDADIFQERVFGMVKSLIAIKSSNIENKVISKD